jgi:hypothetical protein
MAKLPASKIDAIVRNTSHGVWIWRLARIRPDHLDVLVRVGCHRVYLKCFDDRSGESARDFFWAFQCTPEIVEAFLQRGISVVGWGYHFDERTSIPVDAEVEAIAMAMDCGLDGYIVDVEAEVKAASASEPLSELLRSVRDATGDKFVGYTSFGNPAFHRDVPWRLLDEHCDIAFPQIYFEKWTFGASDEDEVQAALQAHRDMGLRSPVLPIWGSEEDAAHPAPASRLQGYLSRFPGSSIFRVPNVGQKGEAWNLDYAGESPLPHFPEDGTRFDPAALVLPEFTEELRRGPKGPASRVARVKLVQRALAARGFDPGPIDGVFGEDTESAVRRFQIVNALTPDGAVGPKTWVALGGTLPPASDVAPEFASASRERLASIAEAEAQLGLMWTGPDSAAEKYLEPLREPMRRLGHIGAAPVFYNWCAAFVTFCARQAGYVIPDQPDPQSATVALVETWKAWAKSERRWFTPDLAPPQRGDIVCFEWFDGDRSLDHIGVVLEGSGNGVTLVTAEGNRNNKTVKGSRNLANVAGVVRLA